MMKLSEAIRLGATMKPQSYTNLFSRRARISFIRSFPFIKLETEELSCALGAAYDAANIGFTEVCIPKGSIRTPFRGKPTTASEDVTVKMWKAPPEWDMDLNRELVCPQCRRTEPLYRLIPHLNDGHRWTRERIADFVERQEGLPVDPIELAHREA